MPEDPYTLLGVDRDVPAAELTRAYERRITELARLDAFKLAQDVDRAYSLLRDPRRRALYDRHGLDQLPRRVHPLQRWAPQKAVPFRAWTPTVVQTSTSAARVTAGRPAARASAGSTCVRAGLAGLAVSAVIALVPVIAHHLHAASAAPPVSPSSQIRVTCQGGPGVDGYSYVTTSGASVGCSNGATPSVESVAP